MKSFYKKLWSISGKVAVRANPVSLSRHLRANTVTFLVVVLSTFWLFGCQHQIKFEDISYTIDTKQYNAGLIAVITPQTMTQTVSVRSFMTGIAHSWNAQPGEMLREVADTEFPQMFRYYRVANTYEEPPEGASRMTVELSVPHYAFSDFHTTAVIHAVAYRPGHILVFDKSYREEGERQGEKMFGAGPFGMNSAVRQSSFDAYKKIFIQLRSDVAKALENSPKKILQP